jgi:hypothetical protein
MNLKLIYNRSDNHSGYGAGSGETVREEYECPCGKGQVIYEKDDIPGFRETDIYSTCNECSDQYVFGRGTAREK